MQTCCTQLLKRRVFLGMFCDLGGLAENCPRCSLQLQLGFPCSCRTHASRMMESNASSRVASTRSGQLAQHAEPRFVANTKTLFATFTTDSSGIAHVCSASGWANSKGKFILKTHASLSRCLLQAPRDTFTQTPLWGSGPLSS